MVAKAGLGLIGLSAISIGGVAVTKPHWLGMDYMPKWHSLSEDNGYPGSTYSQEKFGKKHGRYLVGVTHKNGKTDETNQSWWEWAYRRLQANSPGENSKFNSVGQPYHSSSSNALNKVCEDAYKQEDSGFQTTSSSAQFTKEEVWKYCSVGGSKPQTISEFNSKKPDTEPTEEYGTNNEIGKQSSEQGKLLSIKSPINNWIWDLKDEEFGATNVNEGFFQVRKNVSKRKTIKEICEEVYGKNENTGGSGETKIVKADVTKYCSLEQMNAS